MPEAVASARRALDLAPDDAGAHYNLGILLNEMNKPGDAVACYHRALELEPDYPGARNNLGNALRKQGKLTEAIDCFRRALELEPDFAEAHNNLGGALKDQGQLSEALACYRRALELKPDFAGAHSNLLAALQYQTGITPAELAEAHAGYHHRHATALRSADELNENDHDHHRPLRVGFVSPDLGPHPVGYFLVRVLENLNRKHCETTCYSDRTFQNPLTRRLQAAATQWHDVSGMSDQRLAGQIRTDRVDILFDLAGHSAHNRMLVFARKPAPVQVTWLGYEGTTGLEAMDYLLADRFVAPEGSQAHFCERLLLMPENYVCYDPPAAAPAVGELPALRNAHVTFGSFNNPVKINTGVLSVWARILRQLPESRLILKYRGLGDGHVRQRILDVFSAAQVSPERIALLPHGSYADYLATYNDVDIALDTFPFSGSATTCEGLWMGVPVITCPGETFASRHSLSHLSNLGLEEAIASDPDEYVNLAHALAGDAPRLATLRAGLRERMDASPLCDGQRFADNLLGLLRGISKRDT
jgi:predicted O-linked N-acetylglucosamine transferase (SPINDLY family)